MNLKRRAIQRVRVLLTVVSAVALVRGDTFALALSSIQVDATAQTASPGADVPRMLLQLHQWLQRNPALKDQALIDAVSKQPWDPSIQAMAALPDVVKERFNPERTWKPVPLDD